MSAIDWDKMRKDLIGKQLYLQLNKLLKGPHHGKHRRPSPQAHRDSTDRAGAGAGAFAWPSGSFIPSPSAFLTGTFSKGSGTGIYWRDWYIEEPKPPTLPYAGIQIGEIIGHRMWCVLPDGLYSIAHNFRWELGATIEGKLDELVFRGNPISDNIYGGVYAYASNGKFLQDVYAYSQIALETAPPRRLALDPFHPVNHAIGLARGTVKLWGEVIEHEKGWRAQFAKLASIEEWTGDGSKVPQVLQPYYDSLKETK